MAAPHSRPSRPPTAASPTRSLRFSTLILLAVLASPALANSARADAPQQSAAVTAQSNTPVASNPPAAPSSAAPAAAPTLAPSPLAPSPPGATSTPTSGPIVSISNTGHPQSTAVDTDLPVIITGAATATTVQQLIGAPTLKGTPVIPVYPAASVPPTTDAPFMHRSSLPQGTVFIAVGTILAAFGIAILAWRAIVACLLHRSVARAAAAQRLASGKTEIYFPPAPSFPARSDRRDSSPHATRPVRRSSRGPTTPILSPSMTNLFYSPTAQSSVNLASTTAVGSGLASPPSGTRDSRYLPSGFYSVPANATSGSLTHLRPETPRHPSNTSRYTLASPSPPDSPHPMIRRKSSANSLDNYPAPPARTPSAYLEDLLDDNPAAFPPPNMPPQRPTRPRPSSHLSPYS